MAWKLWDTITGKVCRALGEHRTIPPRLYPMTLIYPNKLPIGLRIFPQISLGFYKLALIRDLTLIAKLTAAQQSPAAKPAQTPSAP